MIKHFVYAVQCLFVMNVFFLLGVGEEWKLRMKVYKVSGFSFSWVFRIIFAKIENYST